MITTFNSIYLFKYTFKNLRSTSAVLDPSHLNFDGLAALDHMFSKVHSATRSERKPLSSPLFCVLSVTIGKWQTRNTCICCLCLLLPARLARSGNNFCVCPNKSANPFPLYYSQNRHEVRDKRITKKFYICKNRCCLPPCLKCWPPWKVRQIPRRTHNQLFGKFVVLFDLFGLSPIPCLSLQTPASACARCAPTTRPSTRAPSAR